jgi:hypothetical protein
VSEFRDVLLYAFQTTTNGEMVFVESELAKAGIAPVAGLGGAIYVVPTQPDQLRSFMARMPGSWALATDPAELPDECTDLERALAAAWAETRFDEMAVVKYAGRPDLGFDFGDLGGCSW